MLGRNIAGKQRSGCRGASLGNEAFKDAFEQGRGVRPAVLSLDEAPPGGTQRIRQLHVAHQGQRSLREAEDVPII
jgi:hypothetical protein